MITPVIKILDPGFVFPGGTFSPGSASHATADGLNGYGHDVEGDKDLEDAVYAGAKEARS